VNGDALFARRNHMHQRYDMYSNVHKGLRRALCLLLARASHAGATSQELHAVASRWHEVQLLLEAHHHHEDVFIGPHLHEVAPSVFARMESEHASLHAELAELAAGARLLTTAEPHDLELRGLRFYRQLAGFVGRYFAHMADEESCYVEALQAAYTDAELAAIEGALVASVEPALMAAFCTEMFPALTANECFLMLDDMRRNAPAPAFASMSQLAQRVVEPATWRVVEAKLSASTAQAPKGQTGGGATVSAH
jgi:uncharacterized protein YerC